MIKSQKFFLLITFGFLTACGGGGGGSSGGSSSSVATSCTTSTSSFCTTEFNNNYGLVTTKVYEAYDDGYTGDGIKVAVLDGGFDTGHTDLDANFITGYDEEDDDNTPNAGSHTAAMGGHGTHVAGTIAAEKNGTGMHGVAYNASIIPIKIFKDSGASMGNITNSVAYGVDQGAIALNNSWGSSSWTSAASCGGVTCYGNIGGSSSSSGFDTSAERAEWEDVKTANAVAVFAAGNEGNNSETGQIDFYTSRAISSTGYVNSYTPQVVKDAGLMTYVNRVSYESRYGLQSAVSGNWLTVVAVDSTNTIADFSNGCGDAKAFCIAAPGVAIYSTVPTALVSSGYSSYNGTSMAAPHVSGAIALMKQKWPNLTGAQIVDLILNSATDLGASGTDEVYGVGLLNMAGAMTATSSQSFSYINGNGLQNLDMGNSSIVANNILSNLVTVDMPIGIVDSYNRVYSTRSSNFNSSKTDKITQEQKFFKLRNGFSSANLLNSNENVKMSFVDYSSKSQFDLKYRSYAFQENQYTNTLLGDDIITLPFIFDNTKLLSNLKDNKNNYVIESSFKNSTKNSTNEIVIGYGYEKNTVLDSNFSGTFETHNNTTLYANFNKSQNISKNQNIYFNFGYGLTKSNFTNDEFFYLTDLTTSSAAVGYILEGDTSKLAFSIIQPLSIESGNAKYKSVSGYDSNGNYKNENSNIDLKNDQKELLLGVYFDKVIDENTNYGLQLSQSNKGSSSFNLVFTKNF